MCEQCEDRVAEMDLLEEAFGDPRPAAMTLHLWADATTLVVNGARVALALHETDEDLDDTHVWLQLSAQMLEVVRGIGDGWVGSPDGQLVFLAPRAGTQRVIDELEDVVSLLAGNPDQDAAAHAVAVGDSVIAAMSDLVGKASSFESRLKDLIEEFGGTEGLLR